MADADALAAWLARSRGGAIAAELDDVRVRIAVLQAELDKLRAELRPLRNGVPARRWNDGSVWPAIGRS